MQKRVWFLALLLLLVAGLVPAQRVQAQEADLAIADLTQSASGLEWQARIAMERSVLTISRPDGQVVRREISAGQPITFEAFDKAGNRLPDGAYTWQLELVPRISNDVRARMAAAREAGDEAALAAIQASLNLPARLIDSGSFRIEAGSIVTAGATEPRPGRPAPIARSQATGTPSLSLRDQVIPDDLIVQGSACVGLDCVNNESFGFDTIRLKENNTRIKFDDTSTGAGFPANDWQLTANDSASGGQSKFSIEDITGSKVPFTVTAGASTNSIFVDSTGRVGFRTSTPVLDLHVNTSNTPALRLEQNSSGGFTAQTWDIAGNEANFFVRDVTGGSRLPLRIRPGAPTSSLDISASGNVGVGTASPGEHLDVTGSGVSNIQTTTFSDTSTDRSDLIFRRARGSSAVPAAIQINDLIGGLAMRGHTGSGFGPTTVSIDARAEENFTATANGTRLVFQTTANGSTTPTTRIVVRQNGRVGVGTTSPTELLHVNGGNILVSGGSFIDDGTTLNVPDYVFEPHYNLMPIDQLANYVEQNKHLPNVPSQDQIKSGGLNMSQFQMRLLEKVEELTLYTVDQHTQISSLSKENQELKDRLAALEAALVELKKAH